MFRLVKSEDTYGNAVTLDLNDFRMGDQVIYKKKNGKRKSGIDLIPLLMNVFG